MEVSTINIKFGIYEVGDAYQQLPDDMDENNLIAIMELLYVMGTMWKDDKIVMNGRFYA